MLPGNPEELQKSKFPCSGSHIIFEFAAGIDGPGQACSCFVGVPVGRLGTPEEIAETVVWMVKTPYLTNKVITVDGGMYAY